MNFNSVLVRVMSLVVVCFMLAYMGFQVFRMLHSPYKTEVAVSHTVADTYTTRSLVLRDEQVTALPKSGVVHYLCEDAEKVTAQTTVAEIFPDANQIALQSQIADLDEEIALLKEVSQSGAGQAAHVDIINRQIAEGVVSAGEIAGSGSMEAVKEVKSQLLKQISKKQLITGKLTGLEGRIASLEAQRESLQAQYAGGGAQRTSVASGAAGYFVRFTDGYENVLGSAYLDQLTVENFHMFLNGQNNDVADPSVNVGKVITNYNWYIVIAVPSEMKERFQVGGSMDVHFMNTSLAPLEVSVDRVVSEKEETESLVVFRCMDMSPELAALRFIDLEVEFKSYTGLRVREDAVCVGSDGDGSPVEGVFVQEKQTPKFKRITRIYQGDGFILSAEPQTDQEKRGYLQQFDVVIVEGKGLYDDNSSGSG